VLLQYEQSLARRRTIMALIANKGGASYTAQITRRIYTPIGMHKTEVDTTTGEFQSDVDELYRWELGLTDIKGFRQGQFGWRVDNFKGNVRESEFGTSDGRRNAFVRFPAQHASIIILTSSPTANTRELADRIALRLLFPPGATK
jgi:hypothetical protein